MSLRRPFRAAAAPALLGLFLLLAPAAPARPLLADDDEPTFLDKSLTYWLKELHQGKTPKARQRGVLAVEQIGHTASKKVVPALVQAMQKDAEVQVRVSAARAVGRAAARAFELAREDKKFPPRMDDARDALAAVLKTEKKHSKLREAAALALGDIGADARGSVGALAAALKDPDAGTVRAAASALRRMGKEARDAQTELMALLGNAEADADARVEAGRAVGLIRPDAAEVLTALRGVLADTKAPAAVRRVTAEAVGKLGGRDASDATKELAALLGEKGATAELRLAAASALDEFGVAAKAAIPALVKALGDSDRFVRCKALHALGQMGSSLAAQRKEAVTAILKATDDPNVEVAVTAVDALASLSSEGLGDRVDEVLKRLDAITEGEARKALVEAARSARDKVRPKKPR